MANNNHLQKHRSFNWWFTKITSSVALVYLVVSLVFADKTQSTEKTTSQAHPIPLTSEHIVLFAIILLFNSDFIEKLESFSFGDLNAKFATKEEVNELGDELDTLLVGTVLDSYEFITLQKVQGKRLDNFSINPSGLALLERLVNRGLIEEKTIGKVFADRNERIIPLRQCFSLTPKGEKYLQVVEKKGISQELEKIAFRIGYTDS